MRNATVKRRVAPWLAGWAAGALLAGPIWAEPPSDPGSSRNGRVLETMDAGRYTYVRIETGSGELWVAGPHVSVAVGDTVVARDAFTMRDFRSKTLDRRFDRIDFASSMSVTGGDETGAAPHAPSPHTTVGSAPPLGKTTVAPAPGGKTIAELYAERNGLADQSVAVRGRVVKVTPKILGRNWIHIRDGSGAEGTQDLTLTTKGEAKVGDTIVATGVLHTDRDFGAGYRYDLIVEDAEITIE